MVLEQGKGGVAGFWFSYKCTVELSYEQSVVFEFSNMVNISKFGGLCLVNQPIGRAPTLAVIGVSFLLSLLLSITKIMPGRQRSGKAKESPQ